MVRRKSLETASFAFACLLVAGGQVATVHAQEQSYGFAPYYTPTNGKVGSHMVSILKFHHETLPAQCVPSVDSADVSGTLPPGLSAPEFGSPGTPGGTIEGTPAQQGDWQVTVTVHGLKCYNSADRTNYGDRSFAVQFHIDDWYNGY